MHVCVCVSMCTVHHKLTGVARNVLKSCKHEVSDLCCCVFFFLFFFLNATVTSYIAVEGKPSLFFMLMFFFSFVIFGFITEESSRK